MTLPEITDQNAVRQAISEFDDLGRDAFLAKYGFGKARVYFVVEGDKRYDSKAIAGAAHGFQHGNALKAAEFSGGECTVAKILEGLGFEIARSLDIPDLIPGTYIVEMNCTIALVASNKAEFQRPAMRHLF